MRSARRKDDKELQSFEIHHGQAALRYNATEDATIRISEEQKLTKQPPPFGIGCMTTKLLSSLLRLVLTLFLSFKLLYAF